MPQNRLFSALAARSGLGAAVSEAVVRSSIVFSSIVFCNSVAADLIVVAASRLLAGCLVARLHA